MTRLHVKTFVNKSTLFATYGGMVILALFIVDPFILTPKEELQWSWFYLFPLSIVTFFCFVILAAFQKFFITIRLTIQESPSEFISTEDLYPHTNY